MLMSWRGGLATICALGAAVGVVGCSSTVGGTATVDTADAPVYQASVSASAAESSAVSSSKEASRQSSITREAVHTSCEAVSSSSADAITSVNAYVDARNANADVAASARPAIAALNTSADVVTGSISDPLRLDLRDALLGWADAARAVSAAIADDIGPSPFNDAINRLNDSRTLVLDLCDAAY
ncbi:hypothetical protein [Mycolicibacterium neoaurum]|uniref:hypothetical protein n=1 Tax=Mycolicibacterium neoaurum TaxID=1795 RepID=UPI001F4D2564|nr:hypothetical protein [Mycolicibacterium neoaurum]